MTTPKKEELLKITENTLIPISLVLVIISGTWAVAKMDSRIDVVEKGQKSMERIEKRLFRIEVKTGVDKPEPLIEGD